MKFHLPVKLFAAVMAAMVAMPSMAGEGTNDYQNPGAESGKLFTGDVVNTFSGDWTGKLYGPAENTGYKVGNTYHLSTVGGLQATTATGTANNVTVNVVAAEDGITKIDKVIGVGLGGYAALGNKEINISGGSEVTAGDYVYVGCIIGGNDYTTQTSGGYAEGTYAEPHYDYTRFAKQTDAEKTITIDVEGGSVGQIRGGASGHSDKVNAAMAGAYQHFVKVYGEPESDAYIADETERSAAIAAALKDYVDNAPWIRNEAVEINVSAGKVGYNADGTDYYDAEAAINGAGGTAHSVNNTVTINISGTADIYGDVYAGALANEYSSYNGVTFPATEVQAFVKNSVVSVSGGKVTGNVYAGGYGKKDTHQSMVKEGTYVELSGGVVTGSVYAAGKNDIVGANQEGAGSQVVIKGAGTQVDGTISGGGESSTIEGDRILTVEAGYTGSHSYKVTDFTSIAVNADVTMSSLTAAEDKGTDVTIADEATLSLTGKDTIHTATNISGGTVSISEATLQVAEGGSLDSKVVLDKHATLDLNGIAASCDIVVYGCTIQGGSNYTGNLYVDGGELTLTDPTCADNVIIDNNGTISGASLKANNVTINNTAETTLNTDLTVNDGGRVTITGGKLNVTGSLTLGANTNIILVGDYAPGDEIMTVTGDINQEENVTLVFGETKVTIENGVVSLVAAFDRALANALTVSNWGIATSSRTFVNTVRGQRTNTGCIADGKGSAWVAVMAANHDIAAADIDIEGSAVGVDMKVSNQSTLGVAVGYTEGDVKPGAVSNMDQESTYLAFYGEHGLKKLTPTSCLSLDWVFAWGDTETKFNNTQWSQESLQLNTRLNWNKKMNDRLCMSVFGGLEYFASESAEAVGVKTGSIQNLRGEIGVGARYVAWRTPGNPAVMDEKGVPITAALPGCDKLVLHGEVRYMNDMVRSNPVIQMDGMRGSGVNPGRCGMGIEAGATYRINDRWSASANYGVNTMEDSREHRVNIGASYTF